MECDKDPLVLKVIMTEQALGTSTNAASEHAVASAILREEQLEKMAQARAFTPDAE